MATCVAERANEAKCDEAGEMGQGAPPLRLLGWATAVLLTVGLAWRLGRYLLQFPIWGDEAFILLNLLDFDYANLAGPLEYAQVAPVLFLWSQEAALNLLGDSELAVRFIPFLAGCGGLLLFWRLSRRALEPYGAFVAVALLAVSYYPVRHACEVKPYALDLLMSVALMHGTLAWLSRPERVGWLLALILLTPIALTASYPAVFVAGACALVMLPPAWRGGLRVRLLYVTFGLAVGAAFLGHYLLVGRNQINPDVARATHDCMYNYWRDSFPPPELWNWPLWLLRVHIGNLFAYPAGGASGMSTVSFVLCVLGVVALWRQQRRDVLALCLLPFLLTLAAATLHKYPYGGSARIAQHLAAPICLLMAAGTTALGLALFRRLRPHAALTVGVALALFGVVGLAIDMAWPYKTFQDWEARRVARELAHRVGPDDVLLLVNHPDDVLSNLTWYLRNERCDVRWMSRDPDPGPEARRLWALFLDVNRNTEQRVWNLLNGREAGWALTGAHRDYIPNQNAYPAWHVLCLHLTRPGASDTLAARSASR